MIAPDGRRNGRQLYQKVNPPRSRAPNRPGIGWPAFIQRAYNDIFNFLIGLLG
jgi:hypothetical protein